MKYGLSDEFVVDVIYKNDLIPEDYSLVDVAYNYNWRKDQPMQFFYRIFKKTKVLLKRRKRKVKTAETVEKSETKKEVKESTSPVAAKKMKEIKNDSPKENLKPNNVEKLKKSPNLKSIIAKTKTTSERFESLFSSTSKETQKTEEKKIAEKAAPQKKEESDEPPEKKMKKEEKERFPQNFKGT